MRVRPRILIAASVASLVISTLSGATTPAAQATGLSLAPQGKVTTMVSSMELPWNEEKGMQVVEVARRYEGFPYIKGANGPYAFDCSSFTRQVYAQFGILLPRVPNDQVKMGPRIPASQAKPGDLMWWPGHVGIYTGNGNHIAARNPAKGIAEGPVWGNPVYIRVLPLEQSY